ncbi:MAG: hypothetical protein E7190_06325 [Erysipelotrichaceae bacterium]|nr:hypothetical protein [Erysipelotrichaceae bacterium]
MMRLTNDLFTVVLNADSHFEMSDEHPGYDIVLNPESFEPDDTYITCRIEITKEGSTKTIALISPLGTDFHDMAVLKENRLFVLIYQAVYEIDLDHPETCSYHPVMPDGFSHGIFLHDDRYLIYSTYAVLCLDERFREQWIFSTDAPITVFKITDERIELVDEDDNRHFVTFEGKRMMR